MPSRRLQHQRSYRSFEHRERLAQFMGRNPNEFVLEILYLFEQTDILMDHQSQWLSILRWRADPRFVWHAQAPPVGRGQWDRVDQEWLHGTRGLANHFLLLQDGFSVQQRAHGGPHFRGQHASLGINNANVVLLQKRAHGLPRSALRAPDTG